MSEIKRFRTKTLELTWTHPVTGEAGSTTFHNELQRVIDNSSSLDDFNRGVIELRDRWNIDPSLLPDLPTN